ncbi:NAD(P)/FAD-dependent oxidoreductase [Wenxinia marina]|uniref:Glycine/D-amino acid oxidase (Deaminating) n=1 Tax=Wenxinia marina DSM 24838 TaxID=1123501 RepID=A0A0D0P7K5_9RHOB|nr:FAD-binding oxidoreductase [Wenxinia marina]KIQ67571.1 Glycine/D-amino acid oxidase (deaminating) [Wenxinia marina DSM 24838]GGL68389.1 glycerol-3-phosphate dehydrogenase [Wenxinia marina]
MSDFLVIGGGIAGISAGARLAELGRVTVLEREPALAYHASGRSAALFEANYGKPAVIALNHASREHHRTARGGVLSPRGLMLVGTPETEAAYREDVAAMKLDEISPQEATALFPILDTASVTAVAHSPDAWDIDTDKLVQDFARDIREAGGRIVTGAEVTAIRRTDAGWSVTAGEEHEAAVLIDAAGAWADVVASMAGIAPIGFTPLRRSMARIAAPEGLDPGGWPMVFGAGEAWYMKPDAGALIVSPADEDPAEPHDAWADDMVLAEGLARYEAHVTAPVTRMLANWAGLRTFAPDRQLVLGPDPSDPSFVWCAGQGGYGFQSSPAASRLLADLVGGRTPELDPATVVALSPSRFR